MDTWEHEARAALLSRRSSLRGRQERGAEKRGPGVAGERLTEQERSELVSIDEALARIEEGRFGRCARCGGAIGHQRLRAVPEARHCWVCSELVGR